MITQLTNGNILLEDKKNKNDDFIYPKLPQSFIETFVSEYNKGNVIKKVLVEYIEDYTSEIQELGSDYKPDLTLKVNQDNTISIKPIEERKYSREEVIAFNKWKSEPIYRAPNEITFRPRCIAQAPDFLEYIIIGTDGYNTLPKGVYYNEEQLFDYWLEQNLKLKNL